ncbi:hypothetical protein APHAL10511_007695 [Amanita phalloides]|nr:hypothetical protein APHAL10511_007695 [Amanita phalloides]
MTSLFRYWLSAGTSGVIESETNTPSTSDSSEVTLEVSPPDDGDGEGSETETERDDRPPAFPSLSSVQRVQTSGSTAPRRVLTDAELMPPPPLPNRALGAGLLQATSTLALPPSTTKPPTSSKKREKVALAPGHGPLDWANLKSSGRDLRGVDTILRIPPSVLKQHNRRDDAWTTINGKVYNITPYLSYHPGGEKQLMRVAGRDGSRLFALTHAWVNVDFMLDACLVGFLIPEPPHS